METTKITIQARISANRQKVWDYYTQASHITKWNFASPDWHCPSASNDMKVGGKYIARMEAKDGSFGFDFEATYSEITENEKFVYIMPDGREVSVSMTDDQQQTNISVCFDAETENPVELQREGWQAILNNFKSYVENN